MIENLTELVPPPLDACRLTVCIPARNEASFIEQTLRALAAQRDSSGGALSAEFFDVLVFANNCTDDTAAVARRFARTAPRLRVFTIEATLTSGEAHIGAARKRVMDAGAERFFAAGRPHGILASLDSDTLVEADWVARIVREMRGHDAVAGQVTIAPTDYASLLAPVRLLYARELSYRRVLAEVEALIDPCPDDPLPRHNVFVGASFAVSARAYRAAGGIPPLPRLEDFAFSQALRQIDARVRHSPLVRASTSARLAARVPGGFGSFLADLHACALRGESFLVDDPQRSLDDMTVRAALRRIRLRTERSDDIERVTVLLALPTEHWLPLLDAGRSFGAACTTILEHAAKARPRAFPARVEAAIATLRAAASAERRRGRVASRGEEEENVDAG